MKKIMIAVVLCLFILLIGCSQKEESADLLNKNISAALGHNGSDTTVSDSVKRDNSETSVPAGQCASGWKCISSTTKAFQKQDCTWGERQVCTLGCFNNTCRAAETCTSGFKCVNNHLKGYQTESCSFINQVECEFGCVDAQCLPENESILGTDASSSSSSDSSAENTAPPTDNSRTLRVGQQDIVNINGEEHTIILSILDPSQVKMSLDGYRSNWLTEGQSFTSYGVTITVKEILFQSFSGGKQEVHYTVE